MLRDADVEFLGENVFIILQKVGLLCQNQEMLKALEDKGAKVDYISEKAVFPKKIVQEFLDEVRKEALKETKNQHRKFKTPPYLL